MLVEVPTGWSHARFGDVMTLQQRRETIDPARIYRLLGVRWYGNGAFLRENRLGDGLSAQHIYPVQSGDVIYNRLFAWKGSFGLVGDDLAGCHVSNEFPLFSARLDRVDPQFLLRILRLPRTAERADAFSTGTTSISRNRLAEEDFLSFPLAFPPLPEQRAIAEVLGAAEAAITTVEASIAQMRETVEVLSEAIFLGIDPATGERKAEDWLSSTLSAEMASIQVGIVVKPAAYYVEAGGVPALRSLNVRRNQLQLNDLVRISDEGHRLNKKSSLRAGDVITVRTGEPGKTAIVPSEAGELNCIDVIFSRPGPRVRADFISYFMNSRLAKRQIAVLQGGLAQQHLNVGEMKRIKVAVPPLAYQDQAIHALQGMWARIEAEEASLEELRSLRGSLAQELLSGRMRLPDSMIARHGDNPGQAA